MSKKLVMTVEITPPESQQKLLAILLEAMSGRMDELMDNVKGEYVKRLTDGSGDSVEFKHCALVDVDAANDELWDDIMALADPEEPLGLPLLPAPEEPLPEEPAVKEPEFEDDTNSLVLPLGDGSYGKVSLTSDVTEILKSRRTLSTFLDDVSRLLPDNSEEKETVYAVSSAIFGEGLPKK